MALIEWLMVLAVLSDLFTTRGIELLLALFE
jgi:hypothetical protein